MTKWALLVLTALALGRALPVPSTSAPALQSLPQIISPASLSPVTSKSPSVPWGHASPGPRPGPRISLSLDVPIGLLRILLEQARARATRERATANARILAHIGRR
ncbi:urocortin-2 [Erinaceus europaeus]|uniref:Urocortin-2 n=1 Tax=Erinaceus europaeus TaxID=9365 RepID=A0A1S3AEA8_ERIEU|nr:urocortin-2 [Erinaceus europaeus]